jgi:hypothetical protein
MVRGGGAIKRAAVFIDNPTQLGNASSSMCDGKHNAYC